MKFLHLINDEKFTDFTISLFEECNHGNNIFLVGINDNHMPPKYTQTKKDQVVFHLIGSAEYFGYIKNCTFDVLVVHFMDYYKGLAVHKIRNNPVIVWLAWGGDIYNTPFYKREIYQAHTARLLNSIENRLIKILKYKYRNFYYYISFRLPPSIIYKNAVNKVSYCATVIPDEINILREWPFFHAGQVPFSYASIEYDFKENYDKITLTGDGIIIGNSADPTSNHIDVFKKLASIGIKDRKIIVPLNYGNQFRYRNLVLKEGEKVFSESFSPLLDFISKSEYINILRECSIAIMNHNRQQGMGNIIILLWIGCKVFLSEKSVTLSYLRKKGFFVYSFQSDLNAANLRESLTKSQVEMNKELLLREYGHQHVVEKARTLINQISNNYWKGKNHC